MPSLAGFRRRQPRTTPAGIADPSIAAGLSQAQGQFGGAIARTGAAGAGLIERRNNELAKTDFEGMKADTATARNAFLQSLRTSDADYNEINKMWSDFKKVNFKKIGNTTKQRKAQQAYGKYVRGIIPQWDKDIDDIAWGVSAQRAKVKLFNSASQTMSAAADFNAGLLSAGMAIERSKLLTSEEKDLVLANAVIDTNPQWYLDNVDAEGTKELFELLSKNQKDALETKARSEIGRIRADQQQATKILNDETRKTAADLLRENDLTDTWLQTNRPNMAATDYERYNNHIISQANAEKKFQASLEEIKDPFNREVFGKLDAAKTVAELDELKRTVNQYVSPEQRKLSVEEGKKWTTQINKRLDDLITTEAEGFGVWSTLDDKVTAVQVNPTKDNIDALSKEIDEAVIAAPGTQALITVNQGTKLQNRLSGIEKNPAIRKRPSLTRAHASLGRLRGLQVGFVTQKDPVLPQLLRSQRGIDLEALTPDEQIIAIESSFIRIAEELDAFADTVAGDKDFDARISQKFNDLTTPVIEDVTLDFLDNLITGFVRSGAGKFDRALAKKRVEDIQQQQVFKNLTTDQQDQVTELIESGFSAEEAVSQVDQADAPEPKTQAEFDAVPSGSRFKDTDGLIKVKQ